MNPEDPETLEELSQHIRTIPLMLWSYNFSTLSFEIKSHTLNSPDPKSFQEIMSNLVIAQKKIPQEDFSKFKIFNNSIKNGYPSSIILRIYNKESRFQWLKIQGTKLTNGSKMVGTIIDITEESEFFQKFNITETLNSKNQIKYKIDSIESDVDQILNHITSFSTPIQLIENIAKYRFPSVPHFSQILKLKIEEKKKRVLITNINGSSQQFPLENSFVEKMKQENLDFFIQTNCYNSTDTIDWAFFIPDNIISYFALPIFYRKKLSNILIFGSNNKEFFSPNDSKQFDIYKRIKI